MASTTAGLLRPISSVSLKITRRDKVMGDEDRGLGYAKPKPKISRFTRNQKPGRNSSMEALGRINLGQHFHFVSLEYRMLSI